MPNPFDYIHPIIDAYLKSQALAQEKERSNVAAVQREREHEDQQKLAQEQLKFKEREMKLAEKARAVQDAINLWNVEQTIRGQYASGIRQPEYLNAGNGPLQTLARSAVAETPLGPIGLSDLTYKSDVDEATLANKRREIPMLVAKEQALATARETAKANAQLPVAQQKAALDVLNKSFLQSLAASDASKLQAQKDAAAMERTKAIAAARRYAADKNGGAGADPQLYAQLFEGIKNGDETLESLTKKYPIKQRAAIDNAAKSEGLVILGDKQKIQISALQILKQVYNKYQELAAAQATNDMSKLPALMQEADAYLGNMARLLGGERGVLTQKDVERARGLRPGYIMGKWDKESSARRLREFKGFYDTSMRAILGGIKGEQRDALVERYTLMDPTPKIDFNDPRYERLQ